MNMYDHVTIYYKTLTDEGIKWQLIYTPVMSVGFKSLLIEHTDNTFYTNGITVRIKTDSTICDVGDLICLGFGGSPNPPDDAFEVVEVTENFKGSPDMWHVKIKAR